jgi:hypothetical protein
MHSTGRHERWLACGVVVLFHVLLGWIGLRAARVPVVAPARDALQVVWIQPRAVKPAQPRVAARSPAHIDPPRIAREPVAERARVVMRQQASPVPEADVAPDMSAVFIEQGRQWAAAQAPIDFSTQRSLGERNNPLPTTPGRFRMRPPPSPHAVLQKIGAMINGPNYAAGPCPQIEKNVAALAARGETLLLAEEVRRQRVNCAP